MDALASRRQVLIVAGPTASGKSALALDAAEAFNGVVINADSMQVYRELRIVTARPSEADEARVPHRLFGDVGAADGCSVGDWLERAKQSIETAFDERRLPIVVGGTGLYLKALIEGLARVPPVPDDVRDAVARQFEEIGGREFRARLGRVDPVTAERLTDSDRQRLTRAVEVHEATGRPLSAWLADGNTPPLEDVRFHTVVLAPPRERLYHAIDGRFVDMIEAGAVAEVEALLALGLDPAVPAMKAVGVREIAGYLAGTRSLDDAIARAQQLSRNYAKRQTTWFKHQLDAGEFVFSQYSEDLRQQIFSFIRLFWLPLQA